MNVDLVVVDDAEAAAREVAGRLAAAAREGKQIALTGGTTPKRAYELAAELEPDWSRAAAWWGDERCVPPGDERSNYGLAKAALLDRLEQHPRVHRIQGELDPNAAAAEYEAELRGTTLDLVLLGMGPDGHVASLFPRSPALRETRHSVVATAAGLAPFVERVTLTLPALSSAHEVLFLVTGEEKAAAAGRAFAGGRRDDTPASLVRGGRTTAVLDRAAARELDI